MGKWLWLWQKLWMSKGRGARKKGGGGGRSWISDGGGRHPATVWATRARLPWILALGLVVIGCVNWLAVHHYSAGERLWEGAIEGGTARREDLPGLRRAATSVWEGGGAPGPAGGGVSGGADALSGGAAGSRPPRAPPAPHQRWSGVTSSVPPLAQVSLASSQGDPQPSVRPPPPPGGSSPAQPSGEPPPPAAPPVSIRPPLTDLPAPRTRCFGHGNPVIDVANYSASDSDVLL